MTFWFVIGAAMFVAAAVLGERHALFIPAVVLLIAAAANVFAGSPL
jgi:hypothetical protein